MSRSPISRKKESRSIPLRFLLAILSVGIIFLGWIYSIVGTVTKWDGKGRYTFIWVQRSADGLHTNQIGVFSIEPEQDRAVYVRLPDRMLVDVPYGYHTYPLGSVYDLGQLDEKRDGALLMEKTIQKTMRIFIDGIIVSKQGEQNIIDLRSEESLVSAKNMYATWGGLFHFLWYRGSLHRTIQTTIPLRTWYQLWRSIKNIRSDQIQFIDLEQTTIISEKTFPDGSIGQEYEPDIFETRLAGLFEHEGIRKESLSVEILNASGADGLAGEAGEMFEKLGVHVISKKTAKKKYHPACTISYTSDIHPDTSDVIHVLINQFGCAISSAPEDVPHQSDVSIILGEEYIQ